MNLSPFLTTICLKFVNLVGNYEQIRINYLFFISDSLYYLFKGYCIMQSVLIIQKLIIFHKEKQKKIMFNEYYLIQTR